MQNSAEEYDTFLKLLDNLITRIDLTMDSTRLTVIKKTVRFAEHNKVFLIPPRESVMLYVYITFQNATARLRATTARNQTARVRSKQLIILGI